MGKTDTIKAQEIVSNSKSNLVSNTPYHENSFIYRTTNEQINKYQDFLKNRENTLSIIASGNQILNTIYEGTKNITGFDISTFPKYYLELQIAALNTFGLKDYINFIYGDIDDEEFDDMYYTINPILDKESREFWDGLLNFFDFSEITASTLFSNEIVFPRNITKKNIYLQNEENYEKTHRAFMEAQMENEYQYEHLMVYYTFRYFMRAFYDNNLLEKAQFAVASFLMVRDMDVMVWMKNGQKFDLQDRIETTKVYAKEVEHSEENIEMLGESFLFEDVFSVKGLLAQIM